MNNVQTALILPVEDGKWCSDVIHYRASVPGHADPMDQSQFSHPAVSSLLSVPLTETTL